MDENVSIAQKKVQTRDDCDEITTVLSQPHI
jgi:hypothetical protein